MNRLVRAVPLLRPARAVGARNMGSHGGPPPTGIEKTVRDVLPEDYQIVLAVLGFYTSIGLVSKLFSGGKAEEVAAVAGDSTSTAIPSIMDESFDEWSKVPGNLAKWEASLDNLESFGN